MVTLALANIINFFCHCWASEMYLDTGLFFCAPPPLLPPDVAAFSTLLQPLAVQSYWSLWSSKHAVLKWCPRDLQRWCLAVAQLVECLLIMQKALDAIPNNHKTWVWWPALVILVLRTIRPRNSDSRHRRRPCTFKFYSWDARSDGFLF